ncbi:MAG: ATP-binding protein [Nocardioidaceae bacterium]
MKHNPLSVNLQTGATRSAPRLARKVLLAVCDGLSEEERDLAAVLTGELVTNAVQHPHPDEPGNLAEIAVLVELADAVLRVEVEDHDGRPLPPVRPPASTCESGRGLYLVSELSNAWGCTPRHQGHGKSVWFEIRYRPENDATTTRQDRHTEPVEQAP